MVEYIVVRCFQCSTFQVKQVTKSNKWSCSLCGAKQSVIKVYGVSGKASDLRKLAQDLNLGRQEAEAAKEAVLLSQVGDGVREEDDFDEALIAELEQREAEHLQAQPQRTVHKWEAYIQHEEGDGEDIFTRDEPVDTQLVTTLPDQSSKRQKRNLSEKGTGSVAHQESGHGQHRNPEPTLVNQDGKSRKGGKRDAGGIAPTARSALQVRDVLRPIQAQGYKRGIKPFEAKEPAWGSARPKAEELTDNSETSRSHTNDIQAAKRVPPQFKWADYIVEESGWNDDCQGSKLASTQDDECGDFSIQTIWGNDEVVE